MEGQAYPQVLNRKGASIQWGSDFKIKGLIKWKL